MFFLGQQVLVSWFYFDLHFFIWSFIIYYLGLTLCKPCPSPSLMFTLGRRDRYQFPRLFIVSVLWRRIPSNHLYINSFQQMRILYAVVLRIIIPQVALIRKQQHKFRKRRTCLRGRRGHTCHSIPNKPIWCTSWWVIWFWFKNCNLLFDSDVWMTFATNSLFLRILTEFLWNGTGYHSLSSYVCYEPLLSPLVS